MYVFVKNSPLSNVDAFGLSQIPGDDYPPGSIFPPQAPPLPTDFPQDWNPNVDGPYPELPSTWEEIYECFAKNCEENGGRVVENWEALAFRDMADCINNLALDPGASLAASWAAILAGSSSGGVAVVAGTTLNWGLSVAICAAPVCLNP